MSWPVCQTKTRGQLIDEQKILVSNVNKSPGTIEEPKMIE